MSLELNIAVTEALAAMFAKRPYDRDVLIRWLQLIGNDQSYGSFDDITRSKVVGIMAEQGFVQVEQLKMVEKNAEGEVSAIEKQRDMWERIAGKRLEELRQCQKQLTEVRKAKEDELDKSINKRAINIGAEIIKKRT